MFCVQCEQTRRTGPVPGCTTTRGTCGKQPETSDLQDLLLHAVQGVAQYSTRCRALGVVDQQAADFVLAAVFATLTNVNFDDDRLAAMIAEAAQLRDRLRVAYQEAAVAAGREPELLTGPAAWVPAPDRDGLLLQAAQASLLSGQDLLGPEVIGLRMLNLYGLKGVCAYAHHARVLGVQDPEVGAGIEAALDYLAGGPTDIEELLARSLEIGQLNLVVLKQLDGAHTGRFGVPVPTRVTTSAIAGRALLVSGHDLADLELILEQTRDLGINVYTHGELLPAHAYPKLAAYPHLVGNYGGAWQDQRSEFLDFPGAVLMTSNCLIEPRAGYRDRIFTLGPVGWPGIQHLDVHDIGPAIAAALALPGFTEDAPATSLMTGFAADAVLAVADDRGGRGEVRGHPALLPGRRLRRGDAGPQLLHGVRRGRPAGHRSLTLGCGKYRFNYTTSARSAGSRGCWTSASATTATPRSGSPGRSPRRSTAGSTTCRSRW